MNSVSMLQNTYILTFKTKKKCFCQLTKPNVVWFKWRHWGWWLAWTCNYVVPQLMELKENPLNLQFNLFPKDFSSDISFLHVKIQKVSFNFIISWCVIVFFEVGCSFGNSSKSDLSLISAPEKHYLSKFRTLKRRKK